MTDANKVQAFKELHDLLLYYAEHRDLPAEEGFNFFDEVKKNCSILEMDHKEFTRTFQLKQL
ncbi:hypothetical protein QRD89_16120 [Halobacillus sp. ACCC02827]|uniref:hypothetical protein n=1 Tax=Halobacillus sp. ACCC02827 TaxID=3052090 RepID=UPI002570AAAA|nr:hypothetical protein [Halobacillus sp. ACCC02827]WJE15229.1 hypothetical protein QRD89_16120 [Halobacillus sp. ACCC02827]